MACYSSTAQPKSRIDFSEYKWIPFLLKIPIMSSAESLPPTRYYAISGIPVTLEISPAGGSGMPATTSPIPWRYSLLR
jgi:hypothetical protein